MDRPVQNSNQHSAPSKGRMMDFAPTKHPAPAPSGNRAINDQASNTSSTIRSSSHLGQSTINARFANQNKMSSSLKMASSAREAVNTAASGVPGGPKSASNLHHGSIQNNMNMESVRASASAILQRSAKPTPKPPRIIESKNSYDPLAHVPSASQRNPARPNMSQDISAPVVKTSLKLNRNVRPKQSPVILPADKAKGASRLSSLLAAQKQRTNTRPTPNPAYQGVSAMRDPQMVNRKTYSEQDFARRQAIETAKNAKMADIIDVSLGTPGRRIEPVIVEDAKERPVSHESVVAQDISRIAEATIAERVPQKLEVKRVTSTPTYNASASVYSAPITNHATPSRPANTPVAHQVTNQTVEQRVAPGTNNFRADNSPTYSFSRPKDPQSQNFQLGKKGKTDNKAKNAGKNRYAATEKSPFLKSVQVDKRPLSDSSIPPQPTMVNTGVTTRSERKKEVKRAKAKQQQNLPSRPTVIIPASRRSRAPLFFLILLTVILGAIVGTATYFFFFNEF